MNKHYLQILIGLIIFIFVIYNRLIRERIPRELYTTLDSTRLIIYLIIIVSISVVLLYNIYKFIKSIFNITNHTNNKYISWCIEKLQNPLSYWTNSLISLDIFIKNKMPNYDGRKNYGHCMVETIAAYLKLHNTLSIKILLLLRICVQSLVCIAFMIDVIVYEKFYYFFNFLWILIIPMIISYIIHSIKLDTDGNLDSLDDALVLKVIDKKDLLENTAWNDPQNVEKFIIVSVNDWYNILKEHNDDDDDEIICINSLSPKILSIIDNNKKVQAFILENCVDHMNMFFGFHSYLERYQQYKERIETPFNVIKYTIYSICWIHMINHAMHIF